MGLTDEEKGLLEKLTAKSKEPDEGEDFSVEWWEEDAKGNRRGGALPWKQGKRIYGTHFPDLFGEKPPETKETKPPKDSGGGGGDEKTSTATKYFGKTE